MPGTEQRGLDTAFERLKAESRWLNGFSKNVYSQTGEDGIVAEALRHLPETDRWCVEFGAWDGKHLSNTYNLVETSGYRVVLIEGSEERYRLLCEEYPFSDRATFVHEFVGWTEADGLDSILAKSAIPKTFDLLSIDVDGNDYHIWKALQVYRPKLVLIEYNPTSSNRFEYVQPADSGCNQSNSPASLVKLGWEKGYEVICVTPQNLLLVDAQYYGLFKIPDNSLAVMRDEDEVTSVFLGFDGSLLVDGPAELRWHGEPLKIRQPFPKMLRKYPPAYSKLDWFVYKVRRKLQIWGVIG